MQSIYDNQVWNLINPSDGDKVLKEDRHG